MHTANNSYIEILKQSLTKKIELLDTIMALNVLQKDMLENPHYIARGSITEWDDENLGRKVKGTNTFPYFKNNPSRIYRGGARYGADTVDVMHELGYSDDEIEKLLGEDIIKA